MSLPTNASQSRERARNYPLLVQENSVIDQAIATASDNGELTVEIANSYMTEPGTIEAQSYYNAWKGLGANETLTDQMNEIIRSFQDRGYKITRTTNNSTLNTFKWIIRW